MASLPYSLRIASNVLAAIRSGFVPDPVYPDTERVLPAAEEDVGLAPNPPPPPFAFDLALFRLAFFANKAVVVPELVDSISNRGCCCWLR